MCTNNWRMWENMSSISLAIVWNIYNSDNHCREIVIQNQKGDIPDSESKKEMKTWWHHHSTSSVMFNSDWCSGIWKSGVKSYKQVNNSLSWRDNPGRRVIVRSFSSVWNVPDLHSGVVCGVRSPTLPRPACSTTVHSTHSTEQCLSVRWWKVEHNNFLLSIGWVRLVSGVTPLLNGF